MIDAHRILRSFPAPNGVAGRQQLSRLDGDPDLVQLKSALRNKAWSSPAWRWMVVKKTECPNERYALRPRSSSCFKDKKTLVVYSSLFRTGGSWKKSPINRTVSPRKISLRFPGKISRRRRSIQPRVFSPSTLFSSITKYLPVIGPVQLDATGRR
jgi:hypothetical protein